MPVAATLAVFAAKTFGVKPVGVFSTPDRGGLFHLFERDGKAILVASIRSEAADAEPLAGGTASVRITDYQGNETNLPAANGLIHLPHASLPYFVEGADLDVLKSYLVPSLGVPSAGGGSSAAGIAAGDGLPRINLLSGKPGAVPVRLQNLYQSRLDGRMHLDLPAGWVPARDVSFSLEPGERKTVPIAVDVPPAARIESSSHRLIVTFDRQSLPAVTKPFAISVIAPESVGNLLKNGDFEEIGADGKHPAHWGGSG